jgi:hypothetical protein
MPQTARHPIVADYLERLSRAAAGLPRSRRAELLADIEAHIAESVGPAASDAEVLSVLDRLGEPEEIVGEDAPAPAPDPRGRQEWAAIWLLLFGGLFVGVGWIIGLIFLWSSRVWTTRDKWIGTLFVPGGLALAVWVGPVLLMRDIQFCEETSDSAGGTADPCGGGETTAGDVISLAIAAILVLTPFVTAVYLARRGARAPAGAAPAHAP